MYLMTVYSPRLDLIQCRNGFNFVITKSAVTEHRRAVTTRNHTVSAGKKERDVEDKSP